MHLEKGSQPKMKFFVQTLTTLTDSLKPLGHLIQNRFIAWAKPARYIENKREIMALPLIW